MVLPNPMHATPTAVVRYWLAAAVVDMRCVVAAPAVASFYAIVCVLYTPRRPTYASGGTLHGILHEGSIPNPSVSMFYGGLAHDTDSQQQKTKESDVEVPWEGLLALPLSLSGHSF